MRPRPSRAALRAERDDAFFAGLHARVAAIDALARAGLALMADPRATVQEAEALLARALALPGPQPTPVGPSSTRRTRRTRSTRR